ncbi:ABC-type amino acid transport/signal transduction system protein [Paramagnetospirillum caucaseum]|uniref:ABC-type amino acid transport/signal transduction system protein n=1 Tax=Paramagnetospirillum caucaseum TaxID=1244869 RepID=M2Z331_9PROT|nr:amino acid ABC transporter [Paramagnetospirillum caucaseum]EME68750.1 ABC-type amino acid transport/signal transduction system protein [Paramagnetospirillum caucaseum]
MIKGWLSLLAAGFLLAAAPAAAAEPRTIEYAYPDQSVWTTRLDSRGEPDNPLLRLAAPLFQQAGIPWRARGLPAARMFEYLADGQTDFSMLVKGPALEKCCLISKRPVAGTELRVYRRKGLPPVTARENLAGKEVITIHGYSYGGILSFIKDPASRVVNHGTVSHESAFAMLERGRADYLLDYAGPAEEILAEHPIAGLEFDVIDRLNVHLVLSRAYPDAEAVMARLEAIADTLRVDGVSRPNLK